MNTRLKIICILFGIIYFYFVGISIIEGIPDAKAGYKQGSENAHRQFNEKNRNAYDETEQTELVFFQVKPLAGFRTFPDSILNLKTGNPIRVELPTVIAEINTSQLPQWIKTGYIALLLLSFPMLIAVVFIPIQIYRVIRSVVKNEIFNPRNITRIRWIGYCLLFISATGIYASFIDTAKARALVQMEDYQVIFKMGEEYYWLLFAVVTFLFAEILKISHTMKEEQDLTI